MKWSADEVPENVCYYYVITTQFAKGKPKVIKMSSSPFWSLFCEGLISYLLSQGIIAAPPDTSKLIILEITIQTKDQEWGDGTHCQADLSSVPGTQMVEGESCLWPPHGNVAHKCPLPPTHIHTSLLCIIYHYSILYIKVEKFTIHLLEQSKLK